MIMTEFEIRQSYKLAKYPKRQITVLSQLNAVPVKTIRAIINKPPKIILNIEDTMMQLYNKHTTDKEMARIIGCSSNKIRKWRADRGLVNQYKNKENKEKHK